MAGGLFAKLISVFHNGGQVCGDCNVGTIVTFSFDGFKRLFLEKTEMACTMENYAINSTTKKSGFLANL